jgi:thymidylate synthase (FAD)
MDNEIAPTKSVKLVSLTNSHVKGIDSPEDLIAYVARVSNPNNQMNAESAPKLMRYLIKNKHWSPFELVHMTVEIKTSRAIAQQILRHRSFSFQEFSQRYSAATSVVQYKARRQDTKNRQNSIDDLSDDTKFWFRGAQGFIENHATRLYQEALNKGIAKEQARFLLPLSTSTVLYMSGSIRSWIHYMQLRMETSTQLEHREIAEEIFNIFAFEFPNIVAAINE